ncbi:MAG: ROK family transcriptional regulator [Anaerolineae bacterium]|nr:ROK family transcriptional regulator [Anaerolineae bacterium]
MSTFVRGNKDLIRAINRNLILNTVRRHGALSRTQITEISRLSVGAVSQITNELLTDQWLLQSGEGDYTGGRRQTLLRLNPAAGCAVGVKLMERRIVCALTDLESRVLRYFDTPMPPEQDPSLIAAALADAVETTVASSGVERGKLLGIGIGLAGVSSPQTGVVHYSPFFGWRDVPLADLVRVRLHLPVYMENDVNTLTLSEMLFGAGRHIDNFAVVTIGRGIGMGLVVNQQLYQGATGGMGELGHITFDPAGPLCTCGKRGCLEAFAADPAVIAYVRHSRSALDAPRTLDDVIALANGGDALARAALARSGEILGIGLATVVNLLCPSLLIVSGEGVTAGDYRIAPMLEALRTHTFNGLLDDVQVIVEPTDDQAWARGAASIVISKVFESPLIEAGATA